LFNVQRMKNLKQIILLLALSTPALDANATNISFATFPDQTLPDILDHRLTKEQLFDALERKDLKVGASQCFNRAHVWAMDMKMKNRIDIGKIFVFYTGKTGHMGNKNWWYHVAPLVNEGGKEYVIDGGFPGELDAPVTIDGWVNNLISTTNCKVVEPTDVEVFSWMMRRHQFPEMYQGKQYDCYLAKVPGAYWTPEAVARAGLGKDAYGKVGDYRVTTIDREEAYSACLEATTNKFGGVLGAGKKKCKRFE